jgi:hypothetical protein
VGENDTKKYNSLQDNFKNKKKKLLKLELDNSITYKKNDCIKLKENDEISQELREKRRGLCRCIECKIARLQIKNQTRKYHCPLFGCTSVFEDRLDFIEHQLKVHGAVYDNIHCQEHEEFLDPHVLPPITVYMVQQYWSPWLEPKRWTINELKEEKQRVNSELSNNKTINHKPRHHLVFKGFRAACARIYKYGQEELDYQFLKALFYYDSSLPYSISSSLDLEQNASIGNGKNWLSGQVKKSSPKKNEIKVPKLSSNLKCLKQINIQKNDRKLKIEENSRMKACCSSPSSSRESSGGETSEEEDEDEDDKDENTYEESKNIFSQFE